MSIKADSYHYLKAYARTSFLTGLSGSFVCISVLVRHYTIVIIACLLVVFTNLATADNGMLNLTAGAEYISGNYGGTEPVEQLYVPLTSRYITNKYAFRLTIPYLRVTGPAGTVQSDGTILPGTGEIITQSGIGDVIAGVTYRDAFNSEVSSDVAIDFTAKVKLGTADADKGLGSGENDYTLQAELYKYLDRLMLFGIVGYKFRGDPDGIELNDSWLSFVGGSYPLTRSLKAGLDFYYQQALFSGLDDQMELSAFLRYKMSNRQYLRAYLIQGFGDASPDWGVGVLISFVQ
jgi:hypothetical protein